MTEKIGKIRFLLLILIVSQSEVFTQPYSTWYNSDHTAWTSATSGGFLAPQFSTFDLDQDGSTEVIIFDRFSGIIQIWVWNGSDVSYHLNKDIVIDWPQLQSWMLVRDYNNDLIPDLFTQGLHGISVYKGIKNGSKIRFEKQEGASYIDDSLIFRNKSGSTTNIYHAASDIPIIEDVDGDGDLDIMSFELSGSYLYYYNNEWNTSGNHLDFSLRHNCWGYFAENQISEDIILADNQLSCPPPFSVRHSGSTSCLADVNLDSLPDLLIGDIGGQSVNVLINKGSVDTGFIERILPSFPDAESPASLRYFPAAYKMDITQDGFNDIIVAVNDYPLSDNEGVWVYAGTQDTTQPFELLTKQWLSNQYIDLGQYSSPYFLNINGDNLLDLLVGYQISENDNGPQNKIAYFEALSSNEFQLMTLDFGSFSNDLTNGYRPYITAGDVDDDGDHDILIGMSSGTCFLIRNATGESNRFVTDNIEQNWAGLKFQSGATLELYDIDGDGDLDVVSGSDNGSIGLYINTGDKVNASFTSDLSLSPNIDKFGQIRTIGQNSLLGRSAPRVINYGGDTLLISGSHQGKLYIYRVKSSDFSSEFDQVEMEEWPNWLGGNARMTLILDMEGKSHLIAGNVAGGLTENHISMVMTRSSDPVHHELNLYPNPVPHGQFLNISLNQSDKIKRQNVIFPTGKLFRSMAVSGNEYSISTVGWSPGLYFLQSILDDNRTIVQKVIIQ